MAQRFNQEKCCKEQNNRSNDLRNGMPLFNTVDEEFRQVSCNNGHKDTQKRQRKDQQKKIFVPFPYLSGGKQIFML